MAQPDASTCPQCGAGLRCGAANGDATCWCLEMPRVVAIPKAVPGAETTQQASCLCPACLQQLIDSNDPKNLSATAD